MKSKVSRSFFDASPLRCDPNRGQRRQLFAVALPRCDPMCGQRGKQHFNETGKEINCDSVVAGDGVGMTSSGKSSSSSACSSPVPGRGASLRLPSGTSCPGAAGRGDALRPLVAGVCVGRTSSGQFLSSSACSSPVPGRGASWRLPSGASCPGASGRGDSLRPLVLRRNSSGGRRAWSDAEKGSVLTPSGKARQCSFVDLFALCTSPQRVHLVDSVVQLSSSHDTHNMHGDVNSCGVVHGGGMHVNSSEMHGNSCGALGHKNSCHVHAAEVRGGTKALSMSTRLGVRCPAVEELASPQQAPGSLHEEVWTSIVRNQGPKIFREVEIIPGCVASAACPACPDCSPEPPGPGRIIRNMIGVTLGEK